MDVPAGLRYTDDHEWLRVEGDEAVIGITAYAAGELGDVVFVELPAVGRKVEPAQTFGVIESVKTASDLYSPAAGEVIAVNDGARRQARAGQRRSVRRRLDGPPPARLTPSRRCRRRCATPTSLPRSCVERRGKY